MDSRTPVVKGAEEPKVLLGLAYAGWAGLGMAAWLAGFYLRLFPFTGYATIVVLSLATVLVGFTFHSYRARSVSLASAAAVGGVALAAYVIPIYERYLWNPFAHFSAPPGLAFIAYMLVALFENPKAPISRQTFHNVIAVSTVLIPLTIPSGIKFQRDLLGPTLWLLYFLILGGWGARYLYSRRFLDQAMR